VIFIYSSIGSAAPPIRQGALADWTGLEFLRFDKTEMEWFSWWPFQIMVGLFCLALILVTVRKIPLTIVNAGVWTIHTGILILAISSVVYFGTKVEGDAVIFQSKALILAPGMTQPATMIVRPQASVVLEGATKPYRISVAQMKPDYTLQTGKDAGKRTQAIWFNVDSGTEQFTRVVLVGYDEYTEDVTGGQRAIKTTGKRLVDEGLQIKLGYDESKYFYHAHAPPVRSTAALYARFSPDQQWTQLRYKNLPHYYEHLAHQNELWVSADQPFPRARASLDLTPQEKPAEFGKLDIRITDYLPYATLESRWIDAGPQAPSNPYVRFRFGSEGRGQTYELLALMPEQRREQITNDLSAEFVWAADDAQRQAAIAKPNPRLVLAIPSKSIERTLPLSSLLGKGPVKVEGTDYTIEMEEPFSGEKLGFSSLWLAPVKIAHGDQKYTRVVLSGERGHGIDVDENRKPLGTTRDADLQIKFLDPEQQRLLLVAGPGSDAVDLVLSMRGGLHVHQVAPVGKSIALGPMAQVTVEQVLERARQDIRPVIVPRSQRQPQQGKLTSLVRVEVNDGQAIQTAWLPYSQYAFENQQWAQPGRFRWAPRTLRLSDGRVLWLLYSQWRDPLPAPIALDRFILETHTGGDRPADYISHIRFWENGKWVPEGDTIVVRSNHPAQKGDKWFFQAQWDPESQAHTVLGVGNRKGVHAMLAGVCISIAGMIYAFYFKPIIIRRRKQAALAEAEARGALRQKPADQPEVAHV
jgi:hypothetical protein